MNPSVAQRGVGSQWEAQIAYAALTYSLPVSLIKAVISQESSWNPNATNLADPSYGLMQINTRAHPDVTPQQMLVPEANITYGSNYLAQQVARYGLEGGISAYNAGHPISGNRAYVDSVLAYKAWFEDNDPASALSDTGSIIGAIFGTPDATPTPVYDMPTDDAGVLAGFGGGFAILLLIAGVFLLWPR